MVNQRNIYNKYGILAETWLQTALRFIPNWVIRRYYLLGYFLLNVLLSFRMGSGNLFFCCVSLYDRDNQYVKQGKQIENFVLL